MKKLLIMMLTLMATGQLSAQDDPEYRMEIGVGAGVANYLGDFNGNLAKDMQPAAALVGRYIFNPFMGLRLAATYGKLKGSSKDVTTYYPDFQQTPYEFDRTLVDVSMTYEYNFWPYGTGRDYRGAKRLTPFIFGGLGATSASGGDKSVFTMNVPMGLGVKYKLAERLNLGVEWGIHFSLSDELDGMKDPYHVESSGAFKNTDCYSTLLVTLTYSFAPKCQTCNKD